MPSSPRTPPRRRRSSNFDESVSSPPSFQYTPTGKRSFRKSFTSSISSPVSTKSTFGPDESLGFGLSNGLGSGADESNGLGNLADELAEAWVDEGGQSPPMANSVVSNQEDTSTNGDNDNRGRPTFEIHHDVGIDMPSKSYDGANDSRSLSPPKQPTRSRPRRKTSNVSDYDGSDYGDDGDFESVEGISTSLEHRLAAIESLARRGLESNGSGSDQVVMRVAESLRDLGSQAGVETSATRLMTAHMAVISNLAHQARLIQTLSHHLVSPLSVPPAPDEIDTLLPLLATTLELLPLPIPRAISSVHNLHSSAIDLIGTLSTLADNLHMFRQTSSLASRRLKAAKDIVDELRKEADLREEGMRWVEKGNWDARLSNRECGAICGDVVDGFRVVCDGWEETIRQSAVGQHALEVGAG